MKIEKTWKEVAETYSQENPDDKITPRTACLVHSVAIDKIRNIIGQNNELREDLLKGEKNDDDYE